MTYWNIGDEEWRDPRLIAAGPAAMALYWWAGSWLMDSIRRRPIPSRWFIPEAVLACWPSMDEPQGFEAAERLAREDLWKRVDGGYEVVWMQPGNRPQAVRSLRDADLAKPSRQARKGQR
jgi:hypothetical protein